MKQKTFEWKTFHHQLYQFYHGAIAISLIPFALLFLEWDSRVAEDKVSEWVFYLVVQLIWVVIYGSWYIWRGSALKYRHQEKADLYTKLLEFRKQNLRKYGLLMLMGLICVGAMWIAPSFIFVLGYFAVLVQYSFLRPSEDKLVRDMKLTKLEREHLHKKSDAQS